MTTNQQDALRMALEALKPFADAYKPEIWTTNIPQLQAFLDSNEVTPKVTMGDFRRAHEAYTTLSTPLPKDAQEEREAFQKACADNGFDYDRVDALSPLAWQAWQWRAALPPSVRPVSLEDAQQAFEQKHARPDQTDSREITQCWRGQMQAFLDGAAWQATNQVAQDKEHGS